MQNARTIPHERKKAPPEKGNALRYKMFRILVS